MLQLFLWQLIADLSEPKDYLQVFRLFPFEGKQKVIHEQEEPAYIKEYLFNVDPITVKVYCIDDTDHCTMLLAEEY